MFEPTAQAISAETEALATEIEDWLAGEAVGIGISTEVALSDGMEVVFEGSLAWPSVGTPTPQGEKMFTHIEGLPELDDPQAYICQVWDYTASYSRLLLRAYKGDWSSGDIWYIFVYGVRQFEGPLGWQGLEFYDAPAEERLQLFRQWKEYRDFTDAELLRQYHLLRVKPEPSRVQIVARGIAASRKPHPDFWWLETSSGSTFKQYREAPPEQKLAILRRELMFRVSEIQACASLIEQAHPETGSDLPHGFDQLINTIADRADEVREILEELTVRQG